MSLPSSPSVFIFLLFIYIFLLFFSPSVFKSINPRATGTSWVIWLVVDWTHTFARAPFRGIFWDWDLSLGLDLVVWRVCFPCVRTNCGNVALSPHLTPRSTDNIWVNSSTWLKWMTDKKHCEISQFSFQPTLHVSYFRNLPAVKMQALVGCQTVLTLIKTRTFHSSFAVFTHWIIIFSFTRISSRSDWH